MLIPKMTGAMRTRDLATAVYPRPGLPVTQITVEIFTKPADPCLYGGLEDQSAVYCTRLLRRRARKGSVPWWAALALSSQLHFTDKANTSKALKARAMGRFFSRPLEVALDRFTGNFRKSQPPHLRHLAIVRDTAQNKKSYHFQYVSFDNFQRLVDSGEASWDSVTLPAKEGKSKKGRAPKPSDESTELDEYGFPTFSQARFANKDGCASLTDGLSAGKVEGVFLTSFDPVIFKDANGRSGRLATFQVSHRIVAKQLHSGGLGSSERFWHTPKKGRSRTTKKSPTT